MKELDQLKKYEELNKEIDELEKLKIVNDKVINMPSKLIMVSLIPANILNFFFEEIALLPFGMGFNALLFYMAFYPLSCSFLIMYNYKYQKWDFQEIKKNGNHLYFAFFMALTLFFFISSYIQGETNFNTYNIIYSSFMGIAFFSHFFFDIYLNKSGKREIRQANNLKNINLEKKYKNEIQHLKTQLKSEINSTESMNFHISIAKENNLSKALHFLEVVKENGINTGMYKTDYQINQEQFLKLNNKNKIINE